MSKFFKSFFSHKVNIDEIIFDLLLLLLAYKFINLNFLFNNINELGVFVCFLLCYISILVIWIRFLLKLSQEKINEKFYNYIKYISITFIFLTYLYIPALLYKRFNLQEIYMVLSYVLPIFFSVGALVGVGSHGNVNIPMILGISLGIPILSFCVLFVPLYVGMYIGENFSETLGWIVGILTLISVPLAFAGLIALGGFFNELLIYKNVFIKSLNKILKLLYTYTEISIKIIFFLFPFLLLLFMEKKEFTLSYHYYIFFLINNFSLLIFYITFLPLIVAFFVGKYFSVSLGLIVGILAIVYPFVAHHTLNEKYIPRFVFKFLEIIRKIVYKLYSILISFLNYTLRNFYLIFSISFVVFYYDFVSEIFRAKETISFLIFTGALPARMALLLTPPIRFFNLFSLLILLYFLVLN